MTVAELNRSFSGKFVEYGGLKLLRPQDALAYIRAGVKQSLKLQGIDGFHRHAGGEIQPDEALHTDIQDYYNPDQVVRESLRIVEAHSDDVQILFVVVMK